MAKKHPIGRSAKRHPYGALALVLVASALMGTESAGLGLGQIGDELDQLWPIPTKLGETSPKLGGGQPHWSLGRGRRWHGGVAQDLGEGRPDFRSEIRRLGFMSLHRVGTAMVVQHWYSIGTSLVLRWCQSCPGIGQMWTEFDQIGGEFGRHRPKLARNCPRVGGFRSMLDPSRPSSAKVRPESARIGLVLPEFGPMLGQSWGRFGRSKLAPMSTEVGPNSAERSPNLATKAAEGC